MSCHRRLVRYDMANVPSCHPSGCGYGPCEGLLDGCSRSNACIIMIKQIKTSVNSISLQVYCLNRTLEASLHTRWLAVRRRQEVCAVLSRGGRAVPGRPCGVRIRPAGPLQRPRHGVLVQPGAQPADRMTRSCACMPALLSVAMGLAHMIFATLTAISHTITVSQARQLCNSLRGLDLSSVACSVTAVVNETQEGLQSCQ